MNTKWSRGLKKYKLVKHLDKKLFQPYEIGVTVLEAYLFTDGKYNYEYIKLSNGAKQVEKIII